MPSTAPSSTASMMFTRNPSFVIDPFAGVEDRRSRSERGAAAAGGGGRVRGVAVQVVWGPVVAVGSTRVGVPHRLLPVLQRDPDIAGGGREGMPQRVRGQPV